MHNDAGATIVYPRSCREMSVLGHGLEYQIVAPGHLAVASIDNYREDYAVENEHVFQMEIPA